MSGADLHALDARLHALDARLHARAGGVFLEVRALPAPEREAALRRLAGEDEALRSEVASLLAHDLAEPAPGASRRPSREAPALLEPPARIGPYRILERLGRGSSGHVFLAEQLEPIKRRVAVKVVPDAALDAELAARFQVERAALEQTEHPGIARILDAGRTDAGLPYLVIELVEGPPITVYCERKALGIADRIRLVLDVADAVQHAHQRGVIHRDLKPGNILVAEVAGRAVPRVLDFGIAKPVAGSFQEETPPTSGLPIGTPAYMAPEQTGLVPVDTRADVYALGAVLYELVAGRPPVDTSGDAADPFAVLRRIREEVPPPASRLLARNAAGRPPDRPGRSFLVDLDCILAKTLEKSRERRYATVQAFAADLRRLLSAEPIEARAPAWSYQLARFAQRNRLLVGAAAVVALACGLGVTGLGVGLVRARSERREAVLQAESQREVNRFLTDDLIAAASPDREGVGVTVLDLLRRATRSLDARFQGRPLVSASIHQALANAYAELGELDLADRHAARALELRRASAGNDAPDTVRSEISAASLLAHRQRFAEAETALRAAVERARRILGAQDADLYAALNDLGVALDHLGRPAEAVPALEEALAGRTRLLAADSREILATINNLAQVVDQQGDSLRSLELLHEALRRAEALEDVPRFTVLGLCNNLGATYQDLDRDLEAAPYLRRAAVLAEETLGPDHPGTWSIQANLAGLESELGDSERAVELYSRVVDQRTVSLGPTAMDTLTARYGYWDSVQLAHGPAEAAAGFESLLRDIDAALGSDHWLSAQTSASLASALVEDDRANEALPHAERAAARLAALFGADHSRAKGAVDLLARIRAGGRD